MALVQRLFARMPVTMWLLHVHGNQECLGLGPVCDTGLPRFQHPLLCITQYQLMTDGHIYFQQEVERKPSDWTRVKEVIIFLKTLSTVQESGTHIPGWGTGGNKIEIIII